MNNPDEHSARVKALALGALEERKARDIVALDVGGITTITDFMIVASGTSDRHVRSIAEFVVESLRSAGLREIGIEGADQGEWVLVDFNDVIVHVMQPEIRAFYNLEKLWELGDAGATSHRRSPTT